MQSLIMNATYSYIAVILSILGAQVWCHLINIGPLISAKPWDDDFEDRIVWRESASLNKCPWNVIIVNFGVVCGGTILTMKTVLTAANCFDNNDKMEEMVVFANSRYLFDPKAIKYRVWDIKKHEKYNDEVKFSNDIAVIMVHNVFRFSDTVQKAVLCNSDVWKNDTETTFVASGWGEIGYKEQMSTKGLMTTNMSLFSRERCLELNNVQMSPDMFCLYGDGLREACRGDSGGAVAWNGMIVGIESHGKGCAKSPGIYVSVFYHLSWIRNTVKSLYNTYCQLQKLSNIT